MTEDKAIAPKTKRWGWMGYIIAGLILALTEHSDKSKADEATILFVAIVCGFLYYRLIPKLGFIKNSFLKGFVLVIILLAIAAFAEGVLLAISRRFF